MQGNSVTRRWSQHTLLAPDYRPEGDFILAVEPLTPAFHPTGDEVDINGVTARYTFDGLVEGVARVAWPLAGSAITLSAPTAAVTIDDFLRVARSIKPDPSGLTAPLSATPLPLDLVPNGVTIAGNDGDDWTATTTLGYIDMAGYSDLDTGRPGAVSVTVGTVTTAPPVTGTPVTVTGHPARFVEQTSRAGQPTKRYLVVDLDSRRVLTVAATGLSRAQVFTVAAAVRASPSLDVSWIGR